MIMTKRRKFDKSFKLEVVQRSLDGITVRQLAEELDIHPGVISRWRRRYLSAGEELSFPGKGKQALTEEQKEIRRLKKALSDSRLETEILKKAIRIFSKSDGKFTNS